MTMQVYDDYVIAIERLRERVGTSELSDADKLVYGLWRATVETPKGTTRGNISLVAQNLIGSGLCHAIYTPVRYQDSLKRPLHYLEYVPSYHRYERLRVAAKARPFIRRRTRRMSKYHALRNDITHCVKRHMNMIDLKLQLQELSR